MRTRFTWLAAALALAALPAAGHAQHAPAACRDSVTGNAVMTAAQLLESERQSHPDSVGRQDFRLIILTQRFEAWTREARRIPRDLAEFAPPVVEVPWLSTCDVWGHRVTMSRAGREVFLRSAGRDGHFDTADDLTRSVSLRHDVPLPEAAAAARP
jgi:hypothetical protein